MSRHVHPKLRASWWLTEGLVGGSARPGFGVLPWMELSPSEAALLTWLGSRHGSSGSLDGLIGFLDEYVDRRAAFLGQEAAAFRRSLDDLLEPEELQRRLDLLAERCEVRGQLDGDRVRVEVTRVAEEAALLREAGIEVLVSLMEREPDGAVAAAGLEVHHLALAAMLPPTREQVAELAGLFDHCEQERRPVLVHCLAGIGRTTTMIAGAQLLRGGSLAELSTELARANPSFRQQGPQWDFLGRLASELP